jgi:hypothetical protein
VGRGARGDIQRLRMIAFMLANGGRSTR